MIKKNLSSILYGVFVWVLGVSFYLLSYFIPILENTELQTNIVLSLAIIPSVYLGTYLFYKKNYIKPTLLALTFIVVTSILDAVVTVPLFILPDGGSYSVFFGDPMFFIILIEFYFITLIFSKNFSKRIKA